MDNPFSRLIQGVILAVFLVLLLPAAVLVFIATSAVMVGLNWLLGSPTGIVGSALTLAWLGGSLALIFGICVLAYRRIPLIRQITHAEEKVDEALFGPPSDTPASAARDPQADAATLYSRVGAADARLAEPPPEGSSPGASESA
jgi:hypothetical protein